MRSQRKIFGTQVTGSPLGVLMGFSGLTVSGQVQQPSSGLVTGSQTIRREDLGHHTRKLGSASLG